MELIPFSELLATKRCGHGATHYHNPLSSALGNNARLDKHAQARGLFALAESP
jgi:hypothetical protein